MIKASQRTRVLAGLLGAALLAGTALEEDSWVQAPFRERQAQIDQLLAERQLQQEQLRRHERQATEIKTWSGETLPFDESQAASVYYPYLTAIATESGLEQVTITPGAVDQAVGDSEARWISLTLTAEATTTQWAGFFQRFHHTRLVQRIARWDLQEASEGRLRGGVTLEAACLQGPTDARVPVAQLPTDLPESLFASANWFGDRTVVATPQVDIAQAEAEEEEVAQPEPEVASTPPTPPLVLVGTWQEGSHEEAWFYESESKTNVVLVKSRHFFVAGKKGEVLRVDRSSVTLRINDREVRVGLGEVFPESDMLTLTAR
jgi:hypothetical protein